MKNVDTLKLRLNELYIENKKSLRTSEHLTITREIMQIQEQLKNKPN